jgi:predicted nucleic acid-binding protein
MQPQSSLSDPDALLVADTSTAINLHASGSSREILRAIPNRVVVAETILVELEAGKRRGRGDADHLKELIKDGFVEVITMGDIGAQHFEELVIGPAAETLDDGEAATIAVAIEHHGIALIDERKAHRLCRTRYPGLRTGCTVDILAHPDVRRALGEQQLASSVLNALMQARMHVLPHHADWVVNLVGPDNAAHCNGLPKSVRQLDETAANHDEASE